MDALRLGFTQRERAVAVALTIYAAIAIAALGPARGALGVGEPDSGPPVPGGGETDGTTAVTPAPRMDSKADTRARTAVVADRRLAAALGSTPYSITKSGPWTTSGDDGTPIRTLGTAFVITPKSPANLRSVALPDAIFDEKSRSASPYQSVVSRVTATDVSELLVLVDSSRDEVVSITPDPGSQVTSAPQSDYRRPLTPEAGTD